ncbi:MULTISPECIES: serine/threonine-protein kinase [Corallococcus]|uniref:serine/threonine protein kinase n=1 Tax=Corallococcus TaxID=83461 RepID=UPI00117D9E6D|nr:MULTISPECIES: serine/threonine-protein kinase [Corallococcus]NBD13054.1 protein kinase [Corallococcus silvisoli]TSC24688.1 protein kinase [Corallococcus sp. Z5C101001]
MAAPCPHCGSTDGLDHLCAAQSLQLLGQVLDGRYKIESVLGQGGMGMVFRATQTSVQRPVAVKTLNPSLAAAPQFFERFRREAEIASRLRHPNVITIFDFGRAADGTCYYVMELLKGESLKELVKREGPMTLRRAVNLLEQATLGLAHAHEEGCVHRDLKPHNIMVQALDGKDFVKVLDFGLVKALEQDEEEQLTSTGQVLGTPQYMPPEQAGGESVDQRSDLYSMAGVLYFCLTGSSPYGANTVRKALTASLTQPVPPVNSKRQGAPVPPELDAFFAKALAPEKEDRYQNAQEFIDSLLDAVEGLSQEELDAHPTGGAPGAERGTGSRSRPGAGSSSRAGSGSKLGSGSRAGRAPGTGAAKTGSRVGLASQPRGTTPAGAQAAPRATTSAANPPLSPANRARPPAPRAEPEAPPPPQGMSGGVKAAIIAVPLLLIGAGVAVVMTRGGGNEAPVTPPPVAATTPKAPVEPPPTRVQDPAPTTPQPAARPQDVTVEFTSTPSGAAIYDGEAQIGTTPTKLVLPRSKASVLRFRLGGHQDEERTLDYSRLADTADQHVNVRLEPVRTAAPTRPTKPPKPNGSDPGIGVFE